MELFITTEPTTQELFNLSGKTVLLTGATGYLGRSLARALAEVGASLIVTGRDEARARAIADALPVTNQSRHYGLSLNHLDHEALTDSFAAAVSVMGSIDILVNNGHEHCKSDWTDCPATEFHAQLTNATGYFLLARLMRDHAVAQSKAASIIMLGSMYGLVGSYPDAYEDISMASPAAYHVLKGGILQLTRHLAVYWARDRVRVNALSPGPFPTPSASRQLVNRLCAKSPMRRMGRPQELKGAVVFLASDASSYMTGHNLVIDGGWTAW